jgi:radical SAM superfamily enzyme YgiQ (UPF0313 family)
VTTVSEREYLKDNRESESMKHYDIVFIHPSSRTSSSQFILMPMGMISLMNELDEYDVISVNIGLEMSLDPQFDLESFLKTIEYDFVGIDLHWHEHAYTALETARICKKVNPNCLVVLGGLTASYFAEELLCIFQHVDVVISGEAEESIGLLLKKEDFSRIPNLVYRQQGHIKKTPVRVPPSLDSFNFSRIVHLNHWEEYLKCNINMHLKARPWCDFWLCTGRGCIYNCSYCGGGRDAQKRICNRDSIFFRSVERVIEDLSYLQERGVHVVNFSQDIHLAGRTYWEPLFAAMKKEGISLGLYLEVFQLVDRGFIEELASACDLRFSTVVITLLSGSEDVRMANGKNFSNQEYYRCAEYLEAQRINHIPYFATGLPFETLETFQETLAMTENLLNRLNLQLLFCTPLRLDPGSPMYERPDHYQVIPHFRSFSDYYDNCRKRDERLLYDYSGYHTTTLSVDEIMKTQSQWEATVKNTMSSAPGLPERALIHFL